MPASHLSSLIVSNSLLSLSHLRCGQHGNMLCQLGELRPQMLLSIAAAVQARCHILQACCKARMPLPLLPQCALQITKADEAKDTSNKSNY